MNMLLSTQRPLQRSGSCSRFAGSALRLSRPSRPHAGAGRAHLLCSAKIMQLPMFPLSVVALPGVQVHPPAASALDSSGPASRNSTAQKSSPSSRFIFDCSVVFMCSRDQQHRFPTAPFSLFPLVQVPLHIYEARYRRARLCPLLEQPAYRLQDSDTCTNSCAPELQSIVFHAAGWHSGRGRRAGG